MVVLEYEKKLKKIVHQYSIKLMYGNMNNSLIIKYIICMKMSNKLFGVNCNMLQKNDGNVFCSTCYDVLHLLMRWV